MSQPDPQNLVARYQALVERYEALDTEIDDLLMTAGGHTEDLAPADVLRYRVLARERDDLESEIRAVEQQLDLNDDARSGDES